MNKESIESIINEEDFNKILQITPNIKDRCKFGFIDNLYKRLVAEEFVRGSISYVPNLTKVQIFKFKKENPNISDIFYYGYQGVVIK